MRKHVLLLLVLLLSLIMTVPAFAAEDADTGERMYAVYTDDVGIDCVHIINDSGTSGYDLYFLDQQERMWIAANVSCSLRTNESFVPLPTTYEGSIGDVWEIRYPEIFGVDNVSLTRFLTNPIGLDEFDYIRNNILVSGVYFKPINEEAKMIESMRIMFAMNELKREEGDLDF